VFKSLTPLTPSTSTFDHSVAFDNAGSPSCENSKLSNSGSLTGYSISGIRYISPFSRWMIGNGSPQYLCLAKTQSLK